MPEGAISKNGRVGNELGAGAFALFQLNDRLGERVRMLL